MMGEEIVDVQMCAIQQGPLVELLSGPPKNNSITKMLSIQNKSIVNQTAVEY